jgi:UDP-GlcNAc:undecaprenyl-phosphate GlcNAc-1-phosphate transferase
MRSLPDFAVAGICALVLNLAITPIIIGVSHRHKWYDLPNGRKIHTSPVPRLGGIGIFVSFLLAGILVPGIVSLSNGDGFSVPFTSRYIPVLAAFCLMWVLGLVDDFRSLPARVKLILQIAAAVLVTLGGFTVYSMRIPGAAGITLDILAYPVTVVWIVGLSNAMNLVDGADGLAGGITAFASAAFGTIFLMRGQMIPALLSFVLLGSTLSFLAFNLPPARIFMGDSGAYLMGFTLSVLPLLNTSGGGSLENLAAAATLLTIPIIDTAAAIVRRIRKKQSISSPDKEHVHHKLMSLVQSEWTLLRFIYIYSLCLSAFALAIGLFGGWIGILLFLVIWAISCACFFKLDRTPLKEKTSPSEAASPPPTQAH